MEKTLKQIYDEIESPILDEAAVQKLFERRDALNEFVGAWYRNPEDKRFAGYLRDDNGILNTAVSNDWCRECLEGMHLSEHWEGDAPKFFLENADGYDDYLQEKIPGHVMARIKRFNNYAQAIVDTNFSAHADEYKKYLSEVSDRMGNVETFADLFELCELTSNHKLLKNAILGKANFVYAGYHGHSDKGQQKIKVFINAPNEYGIKILAEFMKHCREEKIGYYADACGAVKSDDNNSIICALEDLPNCLEMLEQIATKYPEWMSGVHAPLAMTGQYKFMGIASELYSKNIFKFSFRKYSNLCCDIIADVTMGGRKNKSVQSINAEIVKLFANEGMDALKPCFTKEAVEQMNAGRLRNFDQKLIKEDITSPGRTEKGSC